MSIAGDPFDEFPSSAATTGGRLHTLLNSMRSAVLEVDAGGALLYVNPFAREIMPELPQTPAPPGWEREFGTIHTLRDSHGAPIDPLEGPLGAALSTGVPQHDWHFSIDLPSGRELHLLGSAAPLLSENGEVLGAIASYQDVTELIELQDALQKQLDETRTAHQEMNLAHGELSRAHNLQAGFIANFSHDLRTPLSGVLGFSDLLGVSPKLEGAVDEHEYLREVVDAGDTLRMMIDSVISYSNVVAGTVHIHAEWHELMPLLERTTEPARRLCERKGITFELELDEGMTRMRIDEMRLHEVLEQLLDNATKFTSHGTISLKVAREGEEMLFRVSDTGPGISPEAELRLFEPYSKTLLQDGQLRRGVGLGLTLAKALTELMRGRLDYESTLGKGATFILRLPLDFVLPDAADEWNL